MKLTPEELRDFLHASLKDWEGSNYVEKDGQLDGVRIDGLLDLVKMAELVNAIASSHATPVTDIADRDGSTAIEAGKR